jgi:hypothetical protein
MLLAKQTKTEVDREVDADACLCYLIKILYKLTFSDFVTRNKNILCKQI